MAAPLFIRTPIIAQAEVPTMAVPGDEVEVVAATGPTLIERLLYCTTLALSGYVTSAGIINVGLEEYGTGAFLLVKSIPIALHDPSAAGYALSGEIQLDLTIDDGWSLKVIHNIMRTGPHSTTLVFTAQGGVLG